MSTHGRSLHPLTIRSVKNKASIAQAAADVGHAVYEGTDGAEGVLGIGRRLGERGADAGQVEDFRVVVLTARSVAFQSADDEEVASDF